MNICNLESEAQKITALIKISTDEYESIGTGIIIIPQIENSQIGYLFTAQHVITGKDHFLYGDYDSSPIQLVEEGLEVKLNGSILKILQNTFYRPEEKEDFAFGLIDLKANNLLFLPRIKISNYDLMYRQGLHYLTFGYPNITDNIGESLELKSPSELPDPESLNIPRIKLRSEIPVGVARQGQTGSNIADNLEGFSGSGVFFTDHSEIHLTGLVVEALGFSSIIILDFNRIIEKTNDLIEKLPLLYENTKYPLLETNATFNCGKTLVNLKDINNENILKYITENIGNIDINEIDRLKNNSKIINSEKNRIDLLLKELAKNCAYIGAEYNQQKRYNLATRYFNHAISIDNAYSTIFLTAKNNRKKGDDLEEILANSKKIINDPYSNITSKTTALKEKIFILEEKGNNNEVYDTICELLSILSSTTDPNSNDEIRLYIEKCKIIINEENIKQVSLGKLPSIDPYIYMAETCKDFNLLDDTVFFLTCAKELSKLSKSKDETSKALAFINNKIDAFISKDNINPIDIFNAQKHAEKIIDNIKDIKTKTEENILNDIGTIIDKINEIYNKSNDTGILKKIDENIRFLIDKNTNDSINLESSPTNPTHLLAKTQKEDISTAESPTKSRFFNNLLLYCIFAISISSSLSGSTLHIPIH